MNIRADIIDVYILRRERGAISFLQLLRSAAAEALAATWQPVMGHIESDETAAACAVREVGEEVGLYPHDSAWRGLWALQGVHPFFVARIDAIVLSPRFALEVAPEWRPVLNAEHTAWRWVGEAEIDDTFMWPGQRAACREAVELHRMPGAAGLPWISVPLPPRS